MYPVRTEGPKRNQKVLAPSYGLRCAQVPSLRLCSVGPPPRAIHGPSRLSRHPCRSTHSAEPPLGLPGGQADQKHCAPRRPTGRPVRSIQKRPWPRCQTCCVVRPSGSDAVMGLLGVWNILLVEVVLLDKKQEQARRKPLQGNALAIKSEFTLRF